MSARKQMLLIATGLLTIILALGIPLPVQAGENAPEGPSNCIICHENLYYLHDTGKYFCITDARDRCTDCHDGNPAATDKDAAHAHRSAHPVMNQDISKCQECHPADCEEYVQKFNEVAGISPVFVAARPIVRQVQLAAPQAPTSAALPGVSALFIPILAGSALIILALAAFAAHQRRHQA